MVRSYSRWFPPVLTTGRGSMVHDEHGREYIDFLAGAGSLNYGHNDPDLKAALIDYISADGIAHGLDFSTGAKKDFLASFDELVLTPRGLDHRVQFTGPTGANAVEAALKLARKVTGRTNVVAFTNAFHGVSLGALAATGNRHHRMGPEQGVGGVTRLPYEGYLGDRLDTAELLEHMLADPSGGVDLPAAILLETVQGEGGLAAASWPWLRRVARAAEHCGALLIVDDVQAGCGRTGAFFSFEEAGVVPDLVVLSKSLSGFGLPMAVVLIRPRWDRWLPGEHNGTFRGNAHAFVTATAALHKFWAGPRFLQDVRRRADLVGARLADVAASVPGSAVRGRGMMRGLRLPDPEVAGAVRARCAHDGLIIETCGPLDEVLKVLAPLTTPDDVLLSGLQILADSVAGVLAERR